MIPRAPALLSGLLLGALAAGPGCASGSRTAVSSALRRGQLAEALAAYDRGRPDPALLRRIAAASLEHAAQARDPAERAQALRALERGGDAGAPALQRLAARGATPELRAQALLALARLGDGGAREALRAHLDDAGAEVRAAAVEALDPEADIALLRAACEAPAAVVRRAALRVLSRAQPSAATRLALQRVARHDPEPAARAAALHALAHQGLAAYDAIEARLQDASRSVRLAAIDELVALDRARAAHKLERYLGADPSAEGVEAARMLLAAEPAQGPGTARAQLERALADRDGALRAAAAVALMSLRDPSARALALGRVAQERVRSVRLCLAVALGAERPEGRAQLTALMGAQDEVSGQAAAELARHGDAAALARLRALLATAQPLVRQVVVRALALDLGHAREVRRALLDPDAGVRMAAAAAILTAVSKA